MEISEYDFDLPQTIGLPRLFAIGFGGGDYGAVITELLGCLEQNKRDAAALFDLGTILMLNGKRQEGLDCQLDALRLSPLFRQRATGAAEPPLRLLMIAVPGDFMANTPVQFLLEDAGVRLDTLYVSPDGGLPDHIPPHDVLLVGIGESDESAPILKTLQPVLDRWPRPVLNRPADVLKLARERLAATLRPGRGLDVPVTVRDDRAMLELLADGRIQPADILGEGAYPIIARPVGSHAGHGLSKLDTPAAIRAYLQTQKGEDFSISRFVDYRGADGLFRKFRIVLVGGQPSLAHVAIGAHWMLHYLNAGMAESTAKRAEEAALMAAFNLGFAARHREALADLASLAGLDYFAVDCAETSEGKLLVFETDTAMIVHDMDPPDLYPYKHPQMTRIFKAFRKMLHARAHKAHARNSLIAASGLRQMVGREPLSR
ncbi:MAG: ATP-grasp domain-containing protein [Rhizobiaceae bacterium]